MTVAAAPCVILGAGGHAAVLIDCMRRAGGVLPDCLIDADPLRWNTQWDGVPIVGGDDALEAMRARGVHLYAVGVGRTSGPDRRQALFTRARRAGLEPATVIDPSAMVSTRAVVGKGAQIFMRAVVNAGATVGCNAVVNTAAIVEHDCTVSDHAFVASGAILGGGVTIGEGALIGIGATILPGVAIGAAAVVGAGAVVREPVALGTTVVGIPARAARLQS